MRRATVRNKCFYLFLSPKIFLTKSGDREVGARVLKGSLNVTLPPGSDDALARLDDWFQDFDRAGSAMSGGKVLAHK